MLSVIIKEPAILIITFVFLYCIISVLLTYSKTEKNLKAIYDFLNSLNKKELSYRFNQLDEYMCNNSYTSTLWEDFKKALIFPEKLFTATQTQISDYKPEIYLTVDASYFFNEETLVYSKMNHKFIQAMPTLLTGLGPFFTFLKMSMAFSGIDFTSPDVSDSLNELLGNIQVAALCSVFAVGYSLLFMFVEKVLYNKKCKKYYLLIQKELIRLFDICTSEQFLLDLVKESKLQNLNNEKILKSLPEDFAKAISKPIGETITPYLDNILYGINKLNENFGKGSEGDVVDKLF